jgi:hypothetical protein
VKSRTVTGILLLVNVAAAWALLAARAHRAATEPIPELTAVERAAGLNRIVPKLVLNDVPLDESLRKLAQVSGTRIVMSTTLPTLPEHPNLGSIAMSTSGSKGPEWKQPISLRLHDRTVQQVLDVIMDQLNRSFSVPVTYAAREDGTIFVGGEEEMPRVMRAYDFGRILHVIGPGIGKVNPWSEARSPQAELAGLPFDNFSYDRFLYSGAKVECVSTKLIVVASLRWQRSIAQTLRELQTIDREWPAGSRDAIRGPVDFVN